MISIALHQTIGSSQAEELERFCTCRAKDAVRPRIHPIHEQFAVDIAKIDTGSQIAIMLHQLPPDPTTSPAARVAIAFSASLSVESARNRMAPSAKATFAPEV